MNDIYLGKYAFLQILCKNLTAELL